jgi:hypothetical protein
MPLEKIYMPLATGQKIGNEVLAGLAVNDCELFPIVSKGAGGRDRVNIYQNILTAFNIFEGDYIILMDSDILLGTGTIRELLMHYAEMNRVIFYWTREMYGHGLMLIPRDIVEQFKSVPINTDYCCRCQWLQYLDTVNKPAFHPQNLLKEA